MLFNTIKECKVSVTHIFLNENRIGDECFKSLGELLQNNETIQHIEINGNHCLNKITDKGIEVLCSYLIGNLILKSLDFSKNQLITENSVPFLKEIASISYLNNIVLEDTSISSTSQQDIKSLLLVPIEKRDIPLNSCSKSAAKSSIY